MSDYAEIRSRLSRMSPAARMEWLTEMLEGPRDEKL